MSSLLLGIDFGGTKNTVALAEPYRNVWRGSQLRLSPPGSTAQTDLETVIQLAEGLLAQHPGELKAIGVSFGGPVDFDNGQVRLSYHVPGWDNFRLQAFLQERFEVPVCLDNDGNAGAYGEFIFGAGQDVRHLLYITVSTGIGGGWIIDGKPYRGASSMAGEIGHLTIQANGPRCSCGKNGCLEALACGPAIAARAQEKLTQAPLAGTILRALCNHQPETITAKLVSLAAQEGDPLSEEILLEAAGFLGFGIAQVTQIMNPDRIILGGGVTKSGKKYWQEVRRIAQENILPGLHMDIAPTALGDEAPLWGAIALATQILA